MRRRRFLAASGVLALAACAAPGAPPGTRTGYAEVDGGRLYYEIAGAGEPLVLLHAFTLDTRMWDDQFALLAREYRVVRYDARGFGRSSVPMPGRPYSHVADLEALAAHLDLDRPHLVGASMGGRFALDFAIARPEKLRSLVLVGGVIGGWPWSQAWFTSYAPVIEAGKRGDVAAAKAAWLAHPLFASARANPAVFARIRAMVDAYSGWHFVNFNRDPERRIAPAAAQQLGKVRVPTHALIGDRDLADFQRMAEAIELQVPGARRFRVAAAGHMANMEAPQVVGDAIRLFLGAP